MNKTLALPALVLGAALLSGCGILKKKQSEQTPTAAPTLAATPSTAVATPTAVSPTPEPTVTVADDAVPAPEDFEDEAFEKVTDKTYKEQLSALKKEIEAK